MLIHPTHTALKDTEITLNGIGMRSAAYIFADAVLHRIMRRVFFAKRYVLPCISVIKCVAESSCSRITAPNVAELTLLTWVETHLAATFHKRKDGLFANCATAFECNLSLACLFFSFRAHQGVGFNCLTRFAA